MWLFRRSTDKKNGGQRGSLRRYEGEEKSGETGTLTGILTGTLTGTEAGTLPGTQTGDPVDTRTGILGTGQRGRTN